MSVAQLESELTSLNGTELDALEAALRREKQRRNGHVSDAAQTRLHSIIGEALPGGDELRELRRKRDARTLSEEEHARLVALEFERETVWARKLHAVAELADSRDEEFEALYGRLGLNLRAEN